MCVAISKILLEGLGQMGGGGGGGGGGDSMCVAIKGPVRGPGCIRGGSMCVAILKIGVLL